MLLKILFLVIFIQVICGKETATLGEFPWTVSLRLSSFVGHDCGGAILNSVIILKLYTYCILLLYTDASISLSQACFMK